jgi:hypothetical protein
MNNKTSNTYIIIQSIPFFFYNNEHGLIFLLQSLQTNTILYEQFADYHSLTHTHTLSLSLSLSLPPTRARTRARTHTHTHTHSIRRTFRRVETYIHTYISLRVIFTYLKSHDIFHFCSLPITNTTLEETGCH